MLRRKKVMLVDPASIFRLKLKEAIQTNETLVDVVEADEDDETEDPTADGGDDTAGQARDLDQSERSREPGRNRRRRPRRHPQPGRPFTAQGAIPRRIHRCHGAHGCPRF